jgi:hypothetical protein
VDVTCKPCAALEEPVGCALKVKLPGLKLRVLVTTRPVPVRLADCGLPVPSLLTIRDAGLAPALVGAKAIETVQDALGLSEDGQLFPVMLYCPGLAPPSAVEENVTAVLPVEVITMPWGVLVVPVATVPKLKLTGFKVSVLVGVWPVPVREADCGLPVPSLVTTRDAVLAPDVVGAKAIDTVQDEVGFSDEGQLLPWMV